MSKLENHYHSFCKEMEMLGRRYDLARVFEDFLTIAMCSVHQVNIASRLQDKDADNEKLYLDTIKPYNRDELNQFAKLLSLVQLSVYEDHYSDLLGQYFTEHITRGRNGQYFTPEPVCELMAKINGADKNISGQRVYDPACGSGRLLLQFAKTAPNNYFYANDVSLTCGKMSSLNFMFNGLRGEVACMNTLSMEWFKGWQINTPTLGIRVIEKEQSNIWNAPPEKPQEPKQLMLF